MLLGNGRQGEFQQSTGHSLVSTQLFWLNSNDTSTVAGLSGGGRLIVTCALHWLLPRVVGRHTETH